MLKIRNNVFETNSSSMHSIAVTKTAGQYTREEVERENEFDIENGILLINSEDDLEFGWGFKILSSFYTKLTFAMASIGSLTYNDENLVDIVKELFPEVEDIKTKSYSEDYESLIDSFGYVDHQSIGVLQSFLSKSDTTLKDFILSKSYLVIIDNDNTCFWDSFKSSGIVNLDIEEYF